MNKKYFQGFIIITVYILLFTHKIANAGTSGTTAWSGEVLDILANITDKIFTLVGVICLLVLVIGGIYWMTAGGDAERIRKAKQIIIAAVCGLIIALGSKMITTEISNIGS
ncbi:MAG: hypothetical protein PHR47_03970 [Candidatus Pacebacteria bacterium]|nr:hypothetical protein [Candidatus Paceibacterota bacterium]